MREALREAIRWHSDGNLMALRWQSDGTLMAIYWYSVALSSHQWPSAAPHRVKDGIEYDEIGSAISGTQPHRVKDGIEYDEIGSVE